MVKLNQNAEDFARFLNDRKIAAEPLMYNEDNEAYLWLPTSLDDAAYKLLIVFDPNNYYVDIRCFNILENVAVADKMMLLTLLNELNQSKRWGKFYLEENGSVALLASLLSSQGQFVSEDIYELAIMVKATVDSLKSKIWLSLIRVSL